MKSLKYIIPVILSLLLLSCSGKSPAGSLYTVYEGEADLTQWDFSSKGIVHLRGMWEFYCGELLEPRDIDQREKVSVSYIPVPDDWDDFEFSGRRMGSYGYSTYRVRIKTPGDEALYLKIMPPNSAYRLWVNGIFYGGCGRVGRSIQEEKPSYELPVYEVRPAERNIELVLQVSNYSIYLGGLTCSVLLGQRDQIYNDKNAKIAFDVFIFACLLIISIYYLGLFLMRRSEVSSLLFSVFTLLLSFRSLVTNEMFLYQLFPSADWQLMIKIDFIATTLCVPVFIYYIYLLYPVVVRRSIFTLFVASASVYSMMILFFPARVYSRFIVIYNIITVLACVFVIYVLVRAVAHRKEGARLAFAGFLILFITVIHDILAVNNIIHSIQLSSFGVFSFILLQSIILSMKFANAYKRIEELSHNLEIKVRMRTRELEDEKNLLRIRNETIESELMIAKKIQKQIIPRYSPVENMYAFYKPMDKVGGDFYDFLKFRDSHKIGIFLSDVSGHGVPAAFITSMVKTSILQAGSEREDPAGLLAVLNDLLINQTGGHFVTAFYGIYDPQTRGLVYSNSGHNPPFCFTAGSVDVIAGSKSLPLAVLNNDALRLSNKPRTNNSVTLDRGSRVLFYTDGLTEASSFDNPRIFFEDMLVKEVIPKYCDNHPKDFIKNIYSELVRFHGSETFDDDICMICMHVD